VTATPFAYKHILSFDNVYTLKSSNNYIGLNNICIKESLVDINPGNSYLRRLRNNINTIIEEDFIQKKEGIMLITCFRFVSEMKSEAIRISNRYSKSIVLVISSNIYAYRNGIIYITQKNKNLQSLFNKFNGHIILIANRLTNRGINYTDTTYTKYITHQISLSSNNHTSFLQKCRIFGIRPEKVNPILYCIINDPTKTGYITKLKNKVYNLSNSLSQNTHNPEPALKTKITVRDLKTICKENNIKRYSKLIKEQLINLLQENNIDISN